MLILSEVYARAVDAIALAGESGLSVASAAAAATSSAPRGTLVKWLHGALRRSGPALKFQTSDAGDGECIVIACATSWLRAVGHSSLEHPILPELSTRALSLLGSTGRKGTLQAHLANLLNLPFSTAHHYLLSLLASDLVVRRRTLYGRPPDEGAANLEATGVTSCIFVNRFLDAADDRDCDLHISATKNVEGQVVSDTEKDFDENRSAEPRSDVVFELCCRIVDVLRECPSAAASQHDLKQLLAPQECENRHRDFGAARRKLVSASVVTVEQCLCVDESGRLQEPQLCIRLRAEHLRSKFTAGDIGFFHDPNLALAEDTETVVGLTSKHPIMSYYADEGMNHLDNRAGPRGLTAFPGDPVYCHARQGTGLEVVQSSPGSESVLRVDTSLLQESYVLMSKLGTEGFSYIDIERAFAPFVTTRLAKTVYKIMKDGAAGFVEKVKYHGRARRLILVSKEVTGRNVGQVEQPPLPKSSKAIGDCAEPDEDFTNPATGQGDIPALLAMHTDLKRSDRRFLLRTDGYVPTQRPGLSVLAMKRVQITERILRLYGVIRADKVGRAIGVLEGRDYFQVDRRVVDRILDCLVHDGKARKIRLKVSVPTEVRSASKLSSTLEADVGEIKANHTVLDGTFAPAPDLPSNDVLFVCSPEFEESADGVLEQVAAAHRRLLNELPQMQAPKESEFQHAAKAMGKPSVASNSASFVVVACRSECQTGKKPDSVSAELQLCLGRLAAQENGQLRALMPRARLLHKSYIRFAVDPSQVPRKGVSGLGVVSEADVVGNMSLRCFSEAIGIFFNLEDVESQFLYSKKVSSLSYEMQDMLLGSPQGVEQRVILTSLLSRLGLLESLPEDKWQVNVRGVLRDFGKGIPPDLTVSHVVFYDDHSVDEFWAILENYASLEGDSSQTTVALHNTDSAKALALAPVPDSSGQLQIASLRPSVKEVYEEHQWAFDEPSPRTVEDQLTFERVLQKKIISLPSAESRDLFRVQTYGKVDWISKEDKEALYLRMSRQLRSSHAFEKIVEYVRHRFANPVSPEIHARLLRPCKIRPLIPLVRGRRKRLRRSVNPLARIPPNFQTSLPLKRDWADEPSVELDLRLLRLVSELIAVAESQEVLQVRPNEVVTERQFSGLGFDGFGCIDHEMKELWADVSDVVGVEVEICWSRFNSLCRDPALRRHFEAAVCAVRDSDMYTSERHQVFQPSSLGFNAFHSRFVTSRDWPFESPVELRAAIVRLQQREAVKRMRMSAASDGLNFSLLQPSNLGKKAMATKKQRLPSQSAVVPENRSGISSMVALDVVCRGDSSDDAREERLWVSSKVEAECSLSVLSRAVLTLSTVSVEAEQCAHGAEALRLLGEELQVALCIQVVRMVLREPSETFSMIRAVHLLNIFPVAVREKAREALLASGIITRSGVSSACERMFCVPPVLVASNAYNSALLNGVTALLSLRVRLASSVREDFEIESAFVAPSISRRELLATLQTVFAGRSRHLVKVSLHLMPSASEWRERDIPSLEDKSNSSEQGMEGATLLKYCCISGGSLQTRSSDGLRSLGTRAREEIVGNTVTLLGECMANVSRATSLIAAIMKAVGTAALGSGVSLHGLLTHVECVSFPTQNVVCALAFLIHDRAVARIVVPLSSNLRLHSPDGVIYIPYQQACPCDHHLSHNAASCGSDWGMRPLSIWTRMDGSFDEHLCHQTQSCILSALRDSPGSNADHLCRVAKPLNIPDQAVRDALWALTRHGIVDCVYRTGKDAPCSLLSVPTQIVPLAKVLPTVSHFVDGVRAAGLAHIYSANYRLGGGFPSKLLGSHEIIAACESSSGLAAAMMSTVERVLL
jgi:hypothetical protein